MRCPDTTTGRVALVCWLFANGDKLTAAQVAERLGISVRSSQCMLLEICAWFPIYRDKSGEWILLTGKE